MRGAGGPPPILRTDRLVLRPMTLEDVRAVFAYASDPEVARYMTWEAHRAIGDSEAFLRSVVDGYESGGLNWGIVYVGDGRFVGACGMDVVREHARAELGYVLHRGYWGRGLMPEAVRAVIRHGFDALDLNRIQARCVAGNVASARVMEKAGMTYEGTLREHERMKGGFRDVKHYAILRDEYRDRASDR